MKINLTKRLLKSTAAKLIAAFLMSGAVQESHAVVFLWNNTGTNWTSPTSWTNGVQPSSTSSSTTTDEIQFGNFGANNNTVVLTSTRAARNITFLTNANPYLINSFNGTQILSSSGGITNNSTATQTFNINLENANGNNTWLQTAGGALVFNNLVTLTTASSATSRTLTLAGGGTFTFNNSLNQGGTSTAGKVIINAAGGTVNLNAANTLGGGITITAGTVNFSNAGSLGTGVLELGSTTGTTYGNSVLNNASGAAINLTGITGVLWTGTSPAGIQIGTTASTSANNIDFGAGLVTAASDRSMNIAGTGVTISMGTLTTSGTAASYKYKIDGVGNTLDLDGWKISGAATPTQAAQHKFEGSANLNIGRIENGTGAFSNGVGFNTDGTTRLTGNNTYTGATEFTGGGTNIISGNNSAAVGNVTIAGTSGTGKMPVVRLDNVNAISSSSSLLGANSNAQIGTIDFNATTAYTFNSFLGNNMIFTNSYGQFSVVTFTNAVNTFTSSAGNSGGRSLLNNSSNLSIVFDGNVDIGSTSTGLNNTIGGIGDWLIKGNVFSTTIGSVRGLNKTGTGTLELRGANSYNGDTVISGGTLLVATNGSITGSSAQLSGGTLDIRGTIGSVTQTGGTLLVSGTAGTTIVSAGTSTVNAGGTIGSATINGSLLSVNGNAGDVLVNTGGTLGGSGSVQGLTLNGGTVAPGNSPGLLSAYELNGSNGTFQFQLGAPTTRGTTYDAINVTTLLTLGVDTNFTFETLDNYVYADGNTYDLFDWGSAEMSAFNVSVLEAALPTLSSNELVWDTTSFTTDGLISVVSNVPEPSALQLFGIGLISLLACHRINKRNGKSNEKPIIR
jgi:autotransporter-associated beta strand protein